jgi:broad-specificity NMP kinase
MENMSNETKDLDVREETMDDEDYTYRDIENKPEKSLIEKILTGVTIGAVIVVAKTAYDKVKPKVENWRDKRDLARLKKRGYPVEKMSEEPTSTEYYDACYEEVASEETTEE